MSNKSVDASASTSNTRKKLTDEERKAKQRERNKRYYQANREREKARSRLAHLKITDDQRAAARERTHKWRLNASDKQLSKMREHKRHYAVNNKEKCRQSQQKCIANYSEERKEQIRKQDRQRRKNLSPEILEEIRKRQRIANIPEEQRQKNNANARRWAKNNWHQIKERIQQDPARALKVSLRHRLNKAIKGKAKTGSAVRDMGCTGQECCDHLESLFDEHMTWDNYGTYWVVDHIYPLAKANLEDRIEFLAVVNWRNLQPLEKSANATKGDIVYPYAQKLFDDLKTQFLKEDAA